MISAGIRRMIEDGSKASDIKAMDDFQLFNSLSSAGGFAAEMSSCIRSRKLFKRAVYVGLDSLDPSILRVSERVIAQEIAAEAKVDPDYILVDNPSLPDIAEGSFPTLLGGEVKLLREVSPLVSILERAHRATWRMGVYAPADLQEMVAYGARRCLNLKKNTVQHTFSDIDNSYL